jgi:hypothetical protein
MLSMPFQNTQHKLKIYIITMLSMPFQNVQHISKNTHQTCQIFFFPLSFLPTGGGMSELVTFVLFMSKSGGVSLKVMPPATLGGPHEHAGPPPGTLGGPEGFPMRSSITFPRVFGLVCVECAINLPPTLLLAAELVLAFFLVYLVFAPVPLVLFSPLLGAVDVMLAPVPLVLFSPLLGTVDVVLVPSPLALTLFRPRPLVGTVGLSVDGALDVGALEWPTYGALEDSPN